MRSLHGSNPGNPSGKNNASNENLPRVSIIIPTHNRVTSLLECLQSVIQTDYPKLEIIIVNARSDDGTSTMVKASFPELRLIEADDVGYGEANNVGVSQATGDLIASIEDDYRFHRGWLRPIVDLFLKSPDVGVAGGKVYFGDGTQLLAAGGSVDWLRGNTPPLPARKNNDAAVVDVDYVPLPVVRRTVYDTVGLWDPRYFVLFDETDFCIRAKRAGFRVVLVPNSISVHKVNREHYLKHPSKRLYFYFRNRIRFIIKLFPVPYLFSALLFTVGSCVYLNLIFLYSRNTGAAKATSRALAWNAVWLRDTIDCRKKTRSKLDAVKRRRGILSGKV